MSSPDTTLPVILTASNGARYRLLPEVSVPVLGVGQAAWDEGWNQYVTALPLSLEAAQVPQALHVAQTLAQLGLPGLQRVLGVCEAQAGLPAQVILEWPAQEVLATVIAARGPLPLADFAHLSWQTLGTLAAMADHGLPAAQATTSGVLFALGAPPSFRLTFAAIHEALRTGDTMPVALHSFGQMAFHALTGHAWQPGTDAVAALVQLRPDLPSGLLGWLASLLQPDVALRPQQARDALRAAEPVLASLTQTQGTWPMMMPQGHASAPLMHAPMAPAMPAAWPPPPAHASQPLYAASPAQALSPVFESPVEMPAPAPEPAAEVPAYQPVAEVPAPVVAEPPPPSPPPAAAPAPQPSTPQPSTPQPSTPQPRPVTAPMRPAASGPMAARPGAASAGASASAEPEAKPKRPLDKAMIFSLLASVVILAATWNMIWSPMLGSLFMKPVVEGAEEPAAAPAASAPAPASSSVVINTAADLAANVGKPATVTGPVIEVVDKYKPYYQLIVSNQPNDRVQVVLDQSKLPGTEPAQLLAFKGKRITANGIVSDFKGTLELKVASLADLKAE